MIHEERQAAPRRPARNRILEALSMAPGPMPIRSIANLAGMTQPECERVVRELVAVGTVDEVTAGRYWV